MQSKEPPKLLTGWRRFALVCGGLFFVSMGYLGVLLPGLPTTPFLLAASYCFVRSSPRLHRWLHRSPVLGTVLRDWETHRGVRKPLKIMAVCTVITVVSCSIIFGGLPIWLRWVIGSLAVIGVSTIIFIVPTIPGKSISEEVPAAGESR